MSIWSRMREKFGRERGRPWRFVVIRPLNGSQTGNYVLLQAISPYGFPNAEDYILLARSPGGLFRPAYMVRVPFDEDRPMLLDYATRPEVAVIYQDFTLAWTDDGGRSIRTPPEAPEGLFDLWRFGPHRIDRVEIQGEHLYVKMEEGRHCLLPTSAEKTAFIGDGGRMWRLRLDGSGQAAELVAPPIFVSEPAAKQDVFVRGGSQLLMRASPQAAWVEIPPEKLVEQLRTAKIDFFGGTGARYIERPR